MALIAGKACCPGNRFGMLGPNAKVILAHFLRIASGCRAARSQAVRNAATGCMPDSLIDLFGARRGIVCAVGAGGKKTTLYALANHHPGRVGVSATVLIRPFPETLAAQSVIAPAASLEEAVVRAARVHRRVAFVAAGGRRGRLQGVMPQALAALQARVRFDVLLVKADGARMRGIKAPADYEPVLPPGITTVLYLVSAAVLGRPLDEHSAHRVERLAAITGARRGEPLQPLHIARLLSSRQGALQSIGQARLIPVINAVEGAERRQQARSAARQALELSDRFDYVILAAMGQEPPQVEVVRR